MCRFLLSHSRCEWTTHSYTYITANDTRINKANSKIEWTWRGCTERRYTLYGPNNSRVYIYSLQQRRRRRLRRTTNFTWRWMCEHTQSKGNIKHLAIVEAVSVELDGLKHSHRTLNCVQEKYTFSLAFSLHSTEIVSKVIRVRRLSDNVRRTHFYPKIKYIPCNTIALWTASNVV